MKIYFAGSSSSKLDTLKKLGVKNKLYSYLNDMSFIKQWGGKGLLVDSGAFSVFTQGKTVDIKEYTDFLCKFKPSYAIQLDVIGNEAETWKNYQYQKQFFPNILPVIHYQASVEHIKRVIENSEYILLGGLVPLARKRNTLKAWLDYLYSNFDLRHKKIHALGITTRWCLERYPFYSVDSTSWLSPHRYPVSEIGMKMLNQKNKNYKELEKQTIDETLILEKHITKLWESRGVKWN